MEIGSIRAMAPAPMGAPQKPAPPADPVDLPRVAVVPVKESEAGGPDVGARHPADRRSLESRVERDEATGALVFAKVDSASGEVVDQVPSEVLLKVRAMAEAFGEAPASPLPGVDRRV